MTGWSLRFQKQARADLAKARDKNRALEANIVRSPDKLHAEIRRMEDELQAAITGCDNTTCVSHLPLGILTWNALASCCWRWKAT